MPPPTGDGRCHYFAARGAVAGPPHAFADLAGQNARGNWTLCVGDRAGGDTGSVGTWSLTLGTPSSSGPYMPLAIRPAIGPTAPAITVAPPSLAITLAPDVTGSQTFDIGNTGEQIIWFNRFKPAPATFPFSLTQVQTLFRAADGAAVGQTFDV